jgi:signal transduction histidine kinase
MTAEYLVAAFNLTKRYKLVREFIETTHKIAALFTGEMCTEDDYIYVRDIMPYDYNDYTKHYQDMISETEKTALIRIKIHLLDLFTTMFVKLQKNKHLQLSDKALGYLLSMQSSIRNVLIDNYESVIKEKEQAIVEARIAERNRIMANLSHTIKNMIGTIIDPLENMRSSNEYKPVAIDNAIRGANLVRNLVNAMNQSFTGSLDDFAYDVSHATYEGSTSIYDMIVDSLGYAASTMFDGKYFHKFMKNYYPEKAVYRQAKRSWESLPAQKSLAQMESFFSEYMLTPHITIDDATECIIGNDHGSSLKLLILIQEIVLNAVKYASFIQRDNRQLTISFTADDSTVTLLLSNSYDPQNRVKSTGLGNEIIKNFAGILETKPVITQGDTEYTIEIPIQNLWRKG